MMHPKVHNICESLSIEKECDAVRLTWENNMDKASVYILYRGRFIFSRYLSLKELALILGIFIAEDPLRFEDGIDGTSENPILIDNELGRLISVNLDIPQDVARLSYETGPLLIDFNDSHEKIIRNTFSIFH